MGCERGTGVSRASKKASAQRRAGIVRRAAATRALADYQRELDRLTARPLKWSDLGLTREQTAEVVSALYPSSDGQ